MYMRKLQHVQSGLKAPKSQYNKFGNYYRNCEISRRLPFRRRRRWWSETSWLAIGDRYYIRATARFVDCGPGETVENTAYARRNRKRRMDVSLQVTGAPAAMPGNMP